MDASLSPDLTLPPRRRRRWLAAICLAGLVLRLAWALFAAPEPIADFRGYLDAARAVAATDPIAYLLRGTAFRLPVYPLVLGFGAAISTNLVWLRLWNVALSTALIPLVALVGRRLGLSQRAALAGAALVAVSPTFILFAPLMAAEHVLLLLLFGALAIAAAPFGAGAWSRVLVIGVLMGLAALTRIEAVFVWPAVCVAFWLSLRRRTMLPPASRIGRLAAAVGLGVLLLIGWSARNGAVVGPGSGVTTSLGVQLYQAHNPDTYGLAPLSETPLRNLGEVARHRRGMALARDYVAEHPASLLLSATRGTRDLFGVASIRTIFAHPASIEGRMPVGLLAAVAGMAANGWRLLLVLAFAAVLFRDRISRMAVSVGAVLIACTWVGHALVLYGEPRYRLAIVVMGALAGGVTIDGMLARREHTQGDDLFFERWAAVSDETVLVRTITEPEQEPDLEEPHEQDEPDEEWQEAEAWSPAEGWPPDEPWNAWDAPIPEPAHEPEPSAEPTQWWRPVPRAEWSAPEAPPPDADEAAPAPALIEEEPAPAEPPPPPEPEIIYVQRSSRPPRPAPPADDVEVVIPRHRSAARR